MKKKNKDTESEPVNVIVEFTDESVDLVAFVNSVLEYEMARTRTFAGSVILEQPKGHTSALGEGKQSSPPKNEQV